MIPIAFECPRSLLTRNGLVQDYRFGLAHYILDDTEYRRHFYGCEVLDNGFHELGHPLSVPELIEAVRLVQPQSVVAPDWLDDVPRTLAGVRELELALRKLTNPPKLVGVVQGKSPDEVWKCWDAMRPHVNVIALPYRRPRVEWWRHCNPLISSLQPIHLLGVNELSEIQAFRQIPSFVAMERLNLLRIDTAKPYKWALSGAQFTELSSSRNSGIDADTLYNAKLSPVQFGDAMFNVAYLRRLLA